MTDTLLPRVSKADMSMLCMLSIIACRMDVGGATEQLLGMLDDAFTRRIRRAQYVVVVWVWVCCRVCCSVYVYVVY